MSTVASRTFASSPRRDAAETWAAIVDLLTQDRTGPARDELEAVSGIAASIIADRAPETAPIIVTCDGPRTRIYCLYDDGAIEASDANEDTLGFDPLQGNWRLSLPCQKDDLSWVQSTLRQHSAHITAREPGAEVTKAQDSAATEAAALVFDRKGFLGS